MTWHPLSEKPLPYRKVLDCGIQSYDEFACSHSTLSWLQATWSDVALQVVEQCPNGHNVIVKAWPKEGRSESSEERNA
jgi:hypothetical protein